MAAANSEAQSLGESLGVRAAYILWIVRGFSSPILRTWVQKSTLLLQNRGHAEVLKKTPSSAKYVTRCGPPLYPSSTPPTPPPPPPQEFFPDCDSAVVTIINFHCCHDNTGSMLNTDLLTTNVVKSIKYLIIPMHN